MNDIDQFILEAAKRAVEEVPTPGIAQLLALGAQSVIVTDELTIHGGHHRQVASRLAEFCQLAEAEHANVVEYILTALS